LATYTYQFAKDEMLEVAALPALMIVLSGTCTGNFYECDAAPISLGFYFHSSRRSVLIETHHAVL
jgi:hypothetical protein